MKLSVAGLVALATLVALFLWARSNSQSPETRPAGNTAAPAGRSGGPNINAGPAKWDASGRFRCSIDGTSFIRTCGYRLLHDRDAKSVDIWVRNLAKNKAEYRVLHYADDSFTSNDDSKVTAQRKGDNWWVDVEGKEFYVIPDASIRTD